MRFSYSICMPFSSNSGRRPEPRKRSPELVKRVSHAIRRGLHFQRERRILRLRQIIASQLVREMKLPLEKKEMLVKMEMHTALLDTLRYRSQFGKLLVEELPVEECIKLFENSIREADDEAIRQKGLPPMMEMTVRRIEIELKAMRKKKKGTKIFISIETWETLYGIHHQIMTRMFGEKTIDSLWENIREEWANAISTDSRMGGPN